MVCTLASAPGEVVEVARILRPVSEVPSIDSPATLTDWHFPWPAFDADWSRAALLVVDMQNYGCNPDVGLGEMLSRFHPETARYYLPRLTETVIPNVERLVAAFRGPAGRSSSRATDRCSPTGGT